MARRAVLAPRSTSTTSPRPGRSAAELPLRDWKRAFALVDALKAEFGQHAWFHGIRAFWDAHRDAIRIEVETYVPLPERELLSQRHLDRGIGVRWVERGGACGTCAVGA